MTGRKGYLFFICSYWPATATASSFRESFDAADFAGRTDVFQAQAGKPDRRGNDDGGHFIAARFNGPSDRFNHVAQNANFNRGSYRVVEDSWAKELHAGHKVFVDIEPLYEGTSQRPYHLIVTWYVDGRKSFKEFPNEAKGAEDAKR